MESWVKWAHGDIVIVIVMKTKSENILFYSVYLSFEAYLSETNNLFLNDVIPVF